MNSVELLCIWNIIVSIVHSLSLKRGQTTLESGISPWIWDQRLCVPWKKKKQFHFVTLILNTSIFQLFNISKRIFEINWILANAAEYFLGQMHWHHNSMKSKLFLAIANCISNAKTMIAFGDIFSFEFRIFIRWLYSYIGPFKCHWEYISKSKIKLFCWLQKWEIVCSNTHTHRVRQNPKISVLTPDKSNLWKISTFKHAWPWNVLFFFKHSAWHENFAELVLILSTILKYQQPNQMTLDKNKSNSRATCFIPCSDNWSSILHCTEQHKQHPMEIPILPFKIKFNWNLWLFFFKYSIRINFKWIKEICKCARWWKLSNDKGWKRKEINEGTYKSV